ncbi:hypothetical protein [Mucilaginibacter celer]|uniref:Uncharacterized protein n=1 Tax=Mucilaginibacter celer TaxID=2305508 RepID=A0A494W2Z8_9SPHI|nr:hypothetical protein [Mucilaginibacter celer]AYL98123.1 hypothetical protein HYN43_023800 [Mucilaginibacter celer]
MKLSQHDILISVITFLGILLAIMAALVSMKNETASGKKRLNKWGYLFILLNVLFLGLSYLNQYLFKEEKSTLQQQNKNFSTKIKQYEDAAHKASENQDAIDRYSAPDTETELQNCRDYPNARSEYFGTYAFVNHTGYQLLLYAIVAPNVNASPRKYSINIAPNATAQVPRLYVGTTDNDANILNKTQAFTFYFRTLGDTALYGRLLFDVKACTVITHTITTKNMYLGTDGDKYIFDKFER